MEGVSIDKIKLIIKPWIDYNFALLDKDYIVKNQRCKEICELYFYGAYISLDFKEDTPNILDEKAFEFLKFLVSYIGYDGLPVHPLWKATGKISKEDIEIINDGYKSLKDFVLKKDASKKVTGRRLQWWLTIKSDYPNRND